MPHVGPRRTVAGASPAVSTYFVMKLAAESGMKVLLAGDGADEYLGGYWSSYDRIIGGQIRRGSC